MIRKVQFESQERRINQVLAALKENGINSIEEANEICEKAGVDPYQMCEDTQRICFENAKWAYVCGAAIAIILTLCKVPALAFALGMFIPLELNVPLVIGGAVNWYVTTRSKDETINKKRGEKGNLIASGFIAGGALMGVISALLRFSGIQFDYAEWWSNPLSELLSLVAYILLIIYFVRATKE